MFSSTVTRSSALLNCLMLGTYAVPFVHTTETTLFPRQDDLLPPNDKAGKWDSPEYKWIFDFPLYIPPVKEPK